MACGLHQRYDVIYLKITSGVDPVATAATAIAAAAVVPPVLGMAALNDG